MACAPIARQTGQQFCAIGKKHRVGICGHRALGGPGCGEVFGFERFFQSLDPPKRNRKPPHTEDGLLCQPGVTGPFRESGLHSMARQARICDPPAKT